MPGMTEPILGAFRFSQIMNLVTSDLTAEQVAYRTRNGEGASIGWIVGHLMCHRYYILQLFGAANSNPYEKYKDGASAITEYPPISGTLDAWNQLHETLEGTFADTADEELMAVSPHAPHGEKRILDMVIFHMWHEAYHMGQLGSIRTELGLKSTSDLAMGK